MKIQYASDLHLEFPENTEWLANNPLRVTGDVLVLAGDIGIFGKAGDIGIFGRSGYGEHPFWDWAAAHYRQIIAIPGNHEFYRFHDLDTMHDGWRRRIRRNNVRCVYNAVIPLADDIDLIATPLWSLIAVEKAKRTERGVADFSRIKWSGNNLDAARFNDEHRRCFKFLKDAVAASRAKHIIVATHHVPSRMLNALEHQGSEIGGAFTVELFDYIESSPIEYWIYGHSHRNIDALIGGTRCVSNQFGYIELNEHRNFDPAKVIEIG